MEKYCKNCAAHLSETSLFCPDCGKPVNSSNKSERKYRNIIILACALILLAVIGFAISPTPTSDTQTVTVDSFSFQIPDYFTENSEYNLNEYTDGIHTVSKYWYSNNDVIQIEVMSSDEIDMNMLHDDFGGEKEEMYGHTGYYSGLEGTYSFSFVENNKLCTIYTTNPEIFNEIFLN